MRIRTITQFLLLEQERWQEQIIAAQLFLHKSKEAYEEVGYEVQTVRVATQNWQDFTSELTKKQSKEMLLELGAYAQEKKIDELSIGTLIPDEDGSKNEIEFVSDLVIAAKGALSATITIANKGVTNSQALIHGAKAIVDIGAQTENGGGNFGFALLSNCPPHIPYFPAAYAERDCFGIGTENPDLLYSVSGSLENLAQLEKDLTAALEQEMRQVEEIAQRIKGESGMSFVGIDTSLAPNGAEEECSVAGWYETILGEPFGSTGTLTLSELLTRVVKSLDVNKCGYKGLMLPVLEDQVLARLNKERKISVDTILLNSTVCGVGLDVIPLAGDVQVEKIIALLHDLCALSNRYEKPLSARLFPVPGVAQDEMTDFQNQYLVDSVPMKL